jgi:hypothetical protein
LHHVSPHPLVVLCKDGSSILHFCRTGSRRSFISWLSNFVSSLHRKMRRRRLLRYRRRRVGFAIDGLVQHTKYSSLVTEFPSLPFFFTLLRGTILGFLFFLLLCLRFGISLHPIVAVLERRYPSKTRIIIGAAVRDFTHVFCEMRSSWSCATFGNVSSAFRIGNVLLKYFNVMFLINSLQQNVFYYRILGKKQIK